MNIRLLDLVSRFRAFDDRESQVAWFKTLVPWVAPEAYLNIVYKPAPPRLLDVVGTKLSFPSDVVDFLTQQNGAMLFSGALNIYGVVETGQLLNRRDRFSLPPFDIEGENGSWRLDRDRLLVIGGYRLDGSRACIDRSDSHVHVYQRGQRAPMRSWTSLERWVVDEVDRLGALFEDDGKRTGSESETGPPQPAGTS